VLESIHLSNKSVLIHVKILVECATGDDEWFIRKRRDSLLGVCLVKMRRFPVGVRPTRHADAGASCGANFNGLATKQALPSLKVMKRPRR
jgi:hypothetical protein